MGGSIKKLRYYVINATEKIVAVDVTMVVLVEVLETYEVCRWECAYGRAF